MPFGLCNAPAMFTLHVESFLRYGGTILRNLYGWFLHIRRFIHLMSLPFRTRPPMLCWEKSDTELGEIHFIVRHEIVLGHEISKKGIKVDRAKIEVIAKLYMPKCVKDIRSFFGHAGPYRRFIKDFSKIARLLTSLLVMRPSLSMLNAWILGRSLRESLFLH